MVIIDKQVLSEVLCIKTSMKPLIKKFAEIYISDVAEVGGKNASLGEMLTRLTAKGINVPDGFATTAFAFWTFIDYNNLRAPITNLLNELDHNLYSNLS